MAWTSQGTTEPGVFEKHLPQEVESFRVKVQNGIRFCKAPGAGAIGYEARAYDVKVEPGGHAIKSKALTCQSARSNEVKENFAEVQEDARFLFRRERVERFRVDNHFPALVASPRIMPQWHTKASARSQSSGSTSTRHGLSPRAIREAATQQLSKPTISNSLKHKTKLQAEAPRPWLMSGAAEAGELISDRRPALYDERYDSPRAQEREEYSQAKERWLGEATMLPPNKAACQATCNPTWPSLQSHIAAVRERGRAMNESLQERYTAKRQHFQKAQKSKGYLSSFEKRVAQLDRAAEEARRALIKKKTLEAVQAVEHPMAGFKQMVNLKKM